MRALALQPAGALESQVKEDRDRYHEYYQYLEAVMAPRPPMLSRKVHAEDARDQRRHDQDCSPSGDLLAHQDLMVAL